MDETKRKRLEAKGWLFGSAEDFMKTASDIETLAREVAAYENGHRHEESRPHRDGRLASHFFIVLIARAVLELAAEVRARKEG